MKAAPPDRSTTRWMQSSWVPRDDAPSDGAVAEAASRRRLITLLVITCSLSTLGSIGVQSDWPVLPTALSFLAAGCSTLPYFGLRTYPPTTITGARPNFVCPGLPLVPLLGMAATLHILVGQVRADTSTADIRVSPVPTPWQHSCRGRTGRRRVRPLLPLDGPRRRSLPRPRRLRPLCRRLAAACSR